MISIVMTYFNRKQQLIMTLQSISIYASDIEVIIVDDASIDRIEDVPDKFKYPIKLIRVEQKDKWWVNPCMAFNIGFKHIKGEQVIIQDAECAHAGDIVGHVKSNLNDSNYLSYACYAVSYTTYSSMQQRPSIVESLRSILPLRKISGCGGLDGWYNHSRYRPVAYHFTSAITKANLDRLRGFDEEYAHGLGYDDNDFLWRVKQIAAVSIIDDPFSVHLWHKGGSTAMKPGSFIKNRSIYQRRIQS